MHKKVLVALLLLLFVAPQLLLAQTASERRKAKLKEESNTSDFESEDPMFKSYEVPEQWKDRSAVILGERAEYDFGVEKANQVHAKLRRAVKLQDQAAVEAFSTFYFDDSDKNRLGIRIIKPDGTEANVDMTTAVPVDEETVEQVTTFFGTYQRRGYSKKKIAIPGLAIGDVLDFVLAYEETVVPIFFPFCYPIMEVPFEAEYPIVAKAIQFNVRKRFRISAHSMLGAPEFQWLSEDKAEGGRNHIYAASASMIEEDASSMQFTFSSRVMSSIKILICDVRGEQGDEFIHQEQEVMRAVTDEQIRYSMERAMLYRSFNRTLRKDQVIYSRYAWPEVGASYFKKNYDKLFVNLLKSLKPLDALDVLYYKMRHDFSYGAYKQHNLSDELLASILLNCILHAKLDKLDAKFFVAPGYNITSRDALISRHELYWFLKVADGKDSRIYMPPGMHGKLDDRMWQVEDVEAIEVYWRTKEVPKGYKYESLTLPRSQAADNYIKVEADVQVDDALNMRFNSLYTYGGLSRVNNANYILVGEDYANQDEAFVNKMLPAKLQPKSASAARDKRVKAEGRAFNKQENQRKKKEAFEKRLRDMYQLERYDGYEIESTARFPQEDEMQIRHRFLVSDLVAKAGNNLIFNLGMLAGEFSKIDTSKTRVHDIHFNYATTYAWTYNIVIPEGYVVDGLEGIASKVENRAGIFESTAIVEGQVLKVTVRRVYLDARLPAAAWSDMLAFYNAASAFNAKKVVFRKQ